MHMTQEERHAMVLAQHYHYRRPFQSPLQPARVRVRRSLVLAAIVAGAFAQHLLVSAPPESAPSPLHLPAPGVSQAVTGAPRQTVARAPTQKPHMGAARAAAAPVHAALRPHVSTVVKGARLLSPAASTASPNDVALAASIWRAFNAYALPYQSDNALIVAVGRQFGIDPAIPAALFMHEDGDINNRAIFPDHYNWLLYHTRNPGNIKCMYDPCYQGFQVYPTYRAGILDWFRIYDHYYYDLGIHDLARFVATYCPPNVDGNGPPALYQSDVMVKADRIRIGW